MPEILEVETARALLDARALDREISTVHAPDSWFLKRGLTPPAVRAALKGQSFTREVTAKPGRTLHFFCAVHPEMQGDIEVVSG